MQELLRLFFIAVLDVVRCDPLGMLLVGSE